MDIDPAADTAINKWDLSADEYIVLESNLCGDK
jgi:hypothetical protein